jgi:hypothetical protein
MSSDVNDVITGLQGNNAGIIFALVVLTGGYFLFKQTFGTFANNFIINMTDQLKNISLELKQTRETLIAMQTSQSSFDSRIEKIEDDFKKIKCQ